MLAPGKSFLMKTKVFGIGFHKTATTSLATALSYLDYRVTDPNWVDNPNIAEEGVRKGIQTREQV
jgi:hypothetical protein